MQELELIHHIRPLSLVLGGKSAVLDYYLTGYSVPALKRMEMLSGILDKTSNHQSELSTDIRYTSIFFGVISKSLNFLSGSGLPTGLLNDYAYISHEDPAMHILRPSIRSMELGLINLEETDILFIEDFWKKCNLLSDCKELYIPMSQDKSLNLDSYKVFVHDILEYYTELFKGTDALNNKMLTLLGIATFSYKRIIELVDHNLENTISGRTIVRSLAENYMMTKYLIEEESNHDDIWNDFQYYGIGQYKLIYERYAEFSPQIETSHVDFKYIDALVSEFKNKEFIDMDTNYFGSGSIKRKFELVDEGDLWRYVYDYDSQFEHGLWGAIRESSILKCDAPGHMYHGVPDIENMQKLKSVASDCVMIMNKHIEILNKIYQLPDFLLKESYYD